MLRPEPLRLVVGRSGATMKEATVTVGWGNERHSLTLTKRNWSKVRRGQELRIRGSGYWYEGRFFRDYWHFGGGLDGKLVVSYGEDGGEGFVGTLREADIEEF